MSKARTIPKVLFGAAIVGFLSVTGALADREWEETSPYYEDDAWYDVSEWFDANDYNPTDEEAFEWDDETYDFDADEVDFDNDWNYGYSGAGTGTDDDWFYDYYDEGGYSSYDNQDDDDFYEFGSRYYDYDNDGSYDAMATWADWDEDGTYEDYSYYSFNENGDQKKEQQAKDQAPEESRKQRVSGEIQKVKQVQVRGAKHVVVSVAGQGKQMLVDLGRADALKQLDPKKGDSIDVRGTKTKVGDKSVLIAGMVKLGDKETKIDRRRTEINGKVVKSHQAKIRGRQHMIVIVNTGKKGKVAVDLGPSDPLGAGLEQGAELSFRGVPVKVKDRKLMMAREFKTGNGEWTRIDRRDKKGQPTTG